MRRDAEHAAHAQDIESARLQELNFLGIEHQRGEFQAFTDNSNAFVE